MLLFIPINSASHLTQETIYLSPAATQQQKGSCRKLLLYKNPAHMCRRSFCMLVGMEYTCYNSMCYVERESIKRADIQYASCIGIHPTKSFIEPSLTAITSASYSFCPFILKNCYGSVRFDGYH